MIHRTFKICSSSKVYDSIKLLKQTFINNRISNIVFDHTLNNYRSCRDELNSTSIEAELRTNVDTEVLEPASIVGTPLDVTAGADAPNGQADQTDGD